MKDIKPLLFVTVILIAGSAFDVTAQNRSARTASARAAYGMPSEKYKPKAGKKKKVRKIKAKALHGKNKDVKRRRRDSWAG